MTRTVDQIQADPQAEARPGQANEAERPSALIVYDELRERILQGRFDPRVPISQVQLARELGVSRTPLREALRMLQAEGLILSEANRRVRTAQLSLADLEQVYSLRVVLESFGVHLSVPRLTDADIAELRDRLQSVEAALKDGNLDAWEASHSEFHQLTRRYSGERLEAIARALVDHSGRYRRFYLGDTGARAASVQEHRNILEACAARDAGNAAQLVAQHLARTALTTAAAVSPEFDPASVRAALRFAIGGSSGAASGGNPGSDRG
jgi:DNA-binding GntR family transcriptional regulator